ncbi:MAG: hypothetical protein II988_02730 [Clostridia bacterium]|nr:hypothetical protein [Clostridia bacterium]
MVNTAKKKYLKSHTFILLAIFLALFISIFILLYVSNLKVVMDNINDVESVYNIDSNSSVPPNGLFAELSLNGTVISEKHDDGAFKDINVQNLLKDIFNQSEKLTSGKNGKIFYKLVKTGSVYKVFATDATITFSRLYSNVFVALIICVAGFFVMIWLANVNANKIFQPIIDATNRQKQFISDASHELKTPLAIISANAEVMKTDNDPKWISNIQEQTSRLSELVEDMLQMAKIDEDKLVLKKENFDISEEVVNVVLPFEAVVFEKNKRIVMDVQEGIRVNTDRVSVRKTLEILLDNAIKYSSENGTINVGLKIHKHRTVLTVKNTGSNVPNKDSSKIFERFYRAEDSRSREYGGSGLGLAIAKNISIQNKWKIYAKSEYKKSMTITVII